MRIKLWLFDLIQRNNSLYSNSFSFPCQIIFDEKDWITWQTFFIIHRSSVLCHYLSVYIFSHSFHAEISLSVCFESQRKVNLTYNSKSNCFSLPQLHQVYGTKRSLGLCKEWWLIDHVCYHVDISASQTKWNQASSFSRQILKNGHLSFSFNMTVFDHFFFFSVRFDFNRNQKTHLLVGGKYLQLHLKVRQSYMIF